jgi:predicted nucleic acid-binding protein
MSLIVLDTDVASASLRNRLPDRLRAALAGHTMCVTFVTVRELTKWRALRSWRSRRTADLARWRERVGVLAYDEAVADMWGQLQAHAQLRGRPRPHNDTWIAACCLVDDLPLATLNVKDFADFAEYEGLTIV